MKVQHAGALSQKIKFMNWIKHSLFPSITNWRKDYPEHKFRNDYWKMRQTDFFLFHPLGYKWFIFGISSLGSINFIFLSWYFFIKGLPFLLLFTVPIAVRLAWATYLKLKTWNTPNLTTWYELVFKED